MILKLRCDHFRASVWHLLAADPHINVWVTQRVLLLSATGRPLVLVYVHHTVWKASFQLESFESQTGPLQLLRSYQHY